MRRLFALAPVAAALVVVAAAALLATDLTGVASAAPKEGSKNAQIISVDCQGLGSFEVITKDHAASAFGPDGQVFVGKRLSGEVSFTFTTSDGEVFGPFADSFEAGARGTGFEGRLVECTASDTFTETFTLDQGAADQFGIPAEYVGTEVTVTGTEALTFWVIVPGH